MVRHYVLALMGVLLACAVGSYGLQSRGWQAEGYTPQIEFVNVSWWPPVESAVPVPSVESLSEPGVFSSKPDYGELTAIVREQAGGQMQYVIAYEGGVWGFRGECTNTRMHLYTVLDGKSFAKNESEWVLVPPASFGILFMDVLSPQHEGTKSWFYLTCSDGTWKYGE